MTRLLLAAVLLTVLVCSYRGIRGLRMDRLGDLAGVQALQGGR